jgi:RNA polymerase primary sigma factor
MNRHATTSASTTLSTRRRGSDTPGAEVSEAPVDLLDTPSESTGFLAPYFRDLSTVDVMTREEELEAAIRISTLRRTYWRSILSYPPFIEGICDLATQLLPDSEPRTEALAAMKRDSRNLRDRDLLVHQKAYEASCERLTEVLAEADVDGVVSDRVLADLACVEAGNNEGLSMKLKLPRKGSLPFLTYLTAVRKNHHALWTAKMAFVKANLRLVVTIARRFNHGRMALQDLIQEGNIGLMKAVDRFDHRKGFRFSTYGSWWIRHAISRSIADKGRAVRLPVHMIDAHNKVNRARREFEAVHGRRPTDVELAKLTGVSAERIQRMRWSLVENPVSLDQPLSDETGLTFLDAIEDTNTAAPAELMDNELLMDQLREVFAALPPIEADILRKRMGLGDEQEMTLKEIGERYSLSRERIRQLQEQALGKLRSEFKRRDLM